MNRPIGSQNASSSSSNNNNNKEKEQKDETIEKIRLFVLEKVTEYIEKYEWDLITKFTKANLEIANFFFFWLGHRMGPEVPWPNGALGAHGARWGWVRAPKKNPFSKRAGSGPWVLARRSGLDMKKFGLNPTRCHP